MSVQGYDIQFDQDSDLVATQVQGGRKRWGQACSCIEENSRGTMRGRRGLQLAILSSLSTSARSIDSASATTELTRLYERRVDRELDFSGGGIVPGGLRDPEAGWRVWAVPFGVSDPLAWPDDGRAIPSNKITIHLGVGPRRGPIRADSEVTISLLRSIPIVEGGERRGRDCGERGCLTPFARTRVQIAPSFDLNIGPGAEGGYILELYGHNVTTSDAISSPPRDETLLAFQAFHIEAQGPLERAPPFSCPSLPAVTLDSTWEAPPVNIPESLCERYTMNGTVAVARDYYDDRSDPQKSYQPRSEVEIEGMVRRAARRETFYYGKTDIWLYAALDTYPIQGKRVLLIGSNVPWYESICLAFGASECVTVDYNELRYDHPRLRTLTTSQLEAGPEHMAAYDVIWSISSYEHDGLGRYGDPLNPDADLESMAGVAKYLAPEGVLMLAIPVGVDCVVWNAGRVYGARRLPLLLERWHVVESFGFRYSDFDRRTMGEHQPVFVLLPRG